ncbi:MAG: FKBP-type peptidyl-prolyl cis-trans isomerase, partial [Bacteroidota bacterium]
MYKFLISICLSFFMCAQATSDTPVPFKILQEGQGAQVVEGDRVRFHERMSYLGGKQLFDSRELAHAPEATIGAQQIIEGLDSGIRGMRKGELRALQIPPALSKRRIYPDWLSPDSTLIYEVELLEIVSPEIDAGSPAQFTAPVADQTKQPMRIFSSADAGYSWQAASRGLPAEAVVSAWASTPNALLLSTDYHGVFEKKHEEVLWRSASQGLPANVDINAMTAVDTSIWIGTFRHGLYRKSFADEVWESVDLPLEQNAVRAIYGAGQHLLIGTDTGL